MAEAASSTASTVAAARPLLFGTGAADPTFPWAGAALLLVLLAVAAWAWLVAARRGAGARPAWLSQLTGVLAAPGRDIDSPRLRSSTRLDAAARLHVVEWQGRQLLIATNGTAPPVLLTEHRAPQPS